MQIDFPSSTNKLQEHSMYVARKNSNMARVAPGTWLAEMLRTPFIFIMVWM
jgi:hypothetical protein